MLRYKRPPQFEEEEEELEARPSRFITFFGFLIVVAFVILTFNLYQIQVVSGELYKRAADENRFRLVSTDAARGVIYDRNGTILARNEPQFTVSIIPADLPEERQAEIFEKLSALIDVPIETTIQADDADALSSLPRELSRAYISATRRPGLRELVEEGRRTDPFGPVLVKTDIPRLIAFVLQERSSEFPGVRIETRPVRTYPEKEIVAHLLGYVGPIPREQFAEYQRRGYQPNDTVGISGLENWYEDQLRGQKGEQLVMVDANGNVVSRRDQRLPLPGNNLQLTIDLELQKAVAAALKKGMDKKNARQGVAIVMNPNNGEILAMVSLPTYDNNLFARGIKLTDFNALSQDPARPLVNHAITGMYPPGSVFKLVSAAGALQEGVIDAQHRLFDPGVIYVPNRFFPDDPELAQPFYNWYRPGFGYVNIVEAIANSNDIFFYKLNGGFNDFPTPLGQTLLAEYARLFGYGATSGIDLPGEAPGLVPDPRWKQLTLNEPWVTGDTYNMAIGQGFVLATPLQVLNATATIANGGTFYRPHLVRAIVNPTRGITNTIEPQVIRKLPIDDQNLAIVREGMRAAVTYGTAWRANLAQVPVAAKTGTAEFFGPRVGGHLPTHAWFTAYAPYDKPEVAVVVFVYGGGEGSEVAAPITADILRAYFKLPEDSPLAEPLRPPLPPETRNPAPNSPAAQAPPQYVGRVVSVEDNSASERPILYGNVVDPLGRGVAGIIVVLDKGDAQVVASTTTGPDGSFRFENVEFHVSSRWFLRLTGPTSSPGIAVDVLPYKQYRIEFSATLP